MSVIEDLHNLNEQIVDAQLDYSIKRLDLKKTEARLLLETNFEEVTGKSRPTVGDKEAYILLETADLKKAVDEALCEVEELKRTYEITKLQSKLTGNFLNTIAGVVNDDD